MIDEECLLNRENRISVQFPTSISEDLNTITILTTVFKRSKQARERELDFKVLHPEWHSIAIPNMATAAGSSSPGSYQIRPESQVPGEPTAVICHDPLTLLDCGHFSTYRLTVIQSYIVFEGHKHCGTPLDEASIVTLAVYLLSYAKTGLIIKPLCCAQDVSDIHVCTIISSTQLYP